MDPRAPGAGRRASRLPRASVDGPEWDSQYQLHSRAAPRQRGWAVRRGERAAHRHGLLARAGMDPRPRTPASTHDRLPRASDDEPSRHSIALRPLKAAPRAWMDPALPARMLSARWLPCAGPGTRLRQLPLREFGVMACAAHRVLNRLMPIVPGDRVDGRTAPRAHPGSCVVLGFRRGRAARAVCSPWLPRRRNICFTRPARPSAARSRSAMSFRRRCRSLRGSR